MPYRPGKRSAGFRKGRVLAVVAICLTVLSLTVFATHRIYTHFFQPAPGEGTTAPVQLGGIAESTTGSPSGPAPDVTGPPVVAIPGPESLPGSTESGQALTPPEDPTGPGLAITQPEATEPEVTEPEAIATDPTVPETTAPETTASETIVPETTVPPTTVPPTTVPPTTAPATTVPATTVPATTAPAATEPAVDPNIPVPAANGLYSKAALMQRLDGSGGDLFNLDADKRIYPASLTKMMTCIVALENGGSLDANVVFEESMLKGLKEAGASTAGFKVGETVTFRDLLYGLMLPSGADAAQAVAVHTAGSVKAFVDLMNQKAKDLGLSDTHFANTHGLHDQELYSTCRDLAMLLRYCMDNGHFRVLFSRGVYTTTSTPEHPDGITLRNAMTAALAQNPLSRGSVMGNKTGFTTPAGQCLASWAEIGGEDYILITVGAGRSGYNKQRYNMLDAIELYGRIQ